MYYTYFYLYYYLLCIMYCDSLRVTGGEQYLSQELRTAVRPRAREWSPERSLEAVGVAGPSPVQQASKQASTQAC